MCVGRIGQICKDKYKKRYNLLEVLSNQVGYGMPMSVCLPINKQTSENNCIQHFRK